MSTRELLDRHWIPAPVSEMQDALSRMCTVWPARRREMAVPRPARPAPIMRIWGCEEATMRGGGARYVEFCGRGSVGLGEDKRGGRHDKWYVVESRTSC